MWGRLGAQGRVLGPPGSGCLGRPRAVRSSLSPTLPPTALSAPLPWPFWPTGPVPALPCPVAWPHAVGRQSGFGLWAEALRESREASGEGEEEAEGWRNCPAGPSAAHVAHLMDHICPQAPPVHGPGHPTALGSYGGPAPGQADWLGTKQGCRSLRCPHGPSQSKASGVAPREEGIFFYRWKL